MKLFRLLRIPVTLLTLLCACDLIFLDEQTAADYCRIGWEQFHSNQFSGATESFQSALTVDPDYIDAYLGLALSKLRLDDFPGVKSVLATAKPKSQSSAQFISISVILCFVYVQENNAEAIISELGIRISDSDEWTFGHETELNAVDIHNLMCEAYIMKGLFGSEHDSTVNALDAWGQVKKSLQLDPLDSKAIDLRTFLESRA